MTDTVTIYGTRCICICCGTCGVNFAMPEIIYDTCKEEGGFWHCPNGHQRGFREGAHRREAIVRERDRLRQQLAQKDDEIAEAARRLTAETRKRERIERRIHNGTCPDCNRSFANLQRHMAAKHKPKCEVVPLKAVS